ncbi:hypothetical protein SEMRO_2245_G320550.1 [Seminavis robusta]|uniref:Uncharacterized protein n=1 Tax=Seminavis robusta TaxID=568900 RepID=A0A9N8EXC9_9STRA|nr:hypothetical protein SEMRO_2245_G320550.1 [Seminavis robusta]|eukprot:Sro2245_g320550.1 n/a (233) ;mRNA; f:8485-9256
MSAPAPAPAPAPEANRLDGRVSGVARGDGLGHVARFGADEVGNGPPPAVDAPPVQHDNVLAPVQTIARSFECKINRPGDTHGWGQYQYGMPLLHGQQKPPTGWTPQPPQYQQSGYLQLSNFMAPAPAVLAPAPAPQPIIISGISDENNTFNISIDGGGSRRKKSKNKSRAESLDSDSDSSDGNFLSVPSSAVQTTCTCNYNCLPWHCTGAARAHTAHSTSPCHQAHASTIVL